MSDKKSSAMERGKKPEGRLIALKQNALKAASECFPQIRDGQFKPLGSDDKRAALLAMARAMSAFVSLGDTPELLSTVLASFGLAIGLRGLVTFAHRYARTAGKRWRILLFTAWLTVLTFSGGNAL